MRVALLACTFALAAARPALAQDDAAAQAKEHYRKAQEHFNAGRYRQAVTELKKAYEIKPHPAVMRNLGKTYQALGDKDNAIASFKQYLDQMPDAPDHDEIAATVKELEAEKASEAPAVVPVPVPVPAPAPPATEAQPEAQPPPAPGAEEENPLEAARKARLKREAAEAEVSEEEEGGNARPFRIWKWVAGGASVALLGTALLFRSKASSAKSDVEGNVCDPDPHVRCTHAYSESDFNNLQEIDNDNKIFAGTLVGGLLAAGAAGFMFYRDFRATKADEDTEESSLRIAPVVGIGAGGFNGFASEMRF